MKTLNNLLQEHNINQTQPINESALLICGLFGALVMGFAAIFNSSKDNWDDIPEPSDKDKEKAKENVENLSKSTKASFNNFMAELFRHGKNKVDSKIEEMKAELEDAEKKGSESALKVLKNQGKKIKKWIKKQDDKNDSGNVSYYAEVWKKLHKYAKELDDSDGLELAQDLFSMISSRWSNALLDKDKEEAFKVYFSQIGINFDYAWENNGESFDAIGKFVSEAAENAKKQTESGQQNSQDDEQGDKFDKQTVCDYVYKIALATGPKEQVIFNTLLDAGEINAMSAIITLIGATMVISNSKHSDETLQMYQEMFNTLDLKISLTGK